MSITLLTQELKKIYKVCGNIANNKNFHSILQFIKIKTDGSTLIATALNGYMMHQLYFESKSYPTEMLIPIVSVPKDCDNLTPVVITTNKNEISFNFGARKIICENISEEYPNVDKIYPNTNPQSEIWINAEYLVKTCKSFGGTIKLTIYDKLSPLVVESIDHCKKGIIMPIRHQEDCQV